MLAPCARLWIIKINETHAICVPCAHTTHTHTQFSVAAAVAVLYIFVCDGFFGYLFACARSTHAIPGPVLWTIWDSQTNTTRAHTCKQVHNTRWAPIRRGLTHFAHADGQNKGE